MLIVIKCLCLSGQRAFVASALATTGLVPSVFREQVQQEVQNLQAGFDCLFHAMKKPAEEVRLTIIANIVHQTCEGRHRLARPCIQYRLNSNVLHLSSFAERAVD